MVSLREPCCATGQSQPDIAPFEGAWTLLELMILPQALHLEALGIRIKGRCWAGWGLRKRLERLRRGLVEGRDKRVWSVLIVSAEFETHSKNEDEKWHEKWEDWEKRLTRPFFRKSCFLLHFWTHFCLHFFEKMELKNGQKMNKKCYCERAYNTVVQETEYNKCLQFRN